MVATVTAKPTAAELTALRSVASCLEVRADLTGDLDPSWLRAHFGGALLYALRSSGQGGGSDLTTEERRRRLLAAAEQYEIVDLEADHDLAPDVLGRIPAERRRVSWHGRAAGLAELTTLFARSAAVPAQLYLVAPAVTSIEEALAPLRLLRQLGRTDVTAFATGPTGTWTRLLAPRLGAPVVYGRVRYPGDDGIPTVDQLRTHYGFPTMRPLRDLYGIAGRSVSHSLAPRMHNTGFRALGLPALYLPFSASDFGRFWREIVEAGLPALGLPLRGLTVVRPHKEDALSLATTATERASQAAAANSLVRAGQSWRGANTTGVVEPLTAAGVHPAGRTAAVVGCGGAGRSVAAELRRHGATVTLVNRGTPRGRYASRLLGLPWIPLADFSPRGFDLAVNATPLAAESPFDVADLADGAAVADLVYLADAETTLVAAARARGLVVVDGRDVLVAEAGWQFQLMTGQPMPPDAVGIASGDGDGARAIPRALSGLGG